MLRKLIPHSPVEAPGKYALPSLLQLRIAALALTALAAFCVSGLIVTDPDEDAGALTALFAFGLFIAVLATALLLHLAAIRRRDIEEMVAAARTIAARVKAIRPAPPAETSPAVEEEATGHADDPGRLALHESADPGRLPTDTFTAALWWSSELAPLQQRALRAADAFAAAEVLRACAEEVAQTLQKPPRSSGAGTAPR